MLRRNKLNKIPLYCKLKTCGKEITDPVVPLQRFCSGKKCSVEVSNQKERNKSIPKCWTTFLKMVDKDLEPILTVHK